MIVIVNSNSNSAMYTIIASTNSIFLAAKSIKNVRAIVSSC